MAEDTSGTISIPPGGPVPPDYGDPQMPILQIVSQYIKDLSFENPSMGMNVQRPQIDLAVDLQARRISDTGPYEVVLKMRVSAAQDDKTIFLLELAYAGLFVLDRIPAEAIQPMLLIECPRIMFPYARRIVSDMISDGGLPPLMIEPIDFAQLYRSRMAQAQQAAATAV